MARTRASLAAVALLTLVVSGCGAAVDTELSLESEEQGSRTMVAILDEEDIELEELDVDAIDDALSDNVPDGLTYDGMDSNDDGARATFVLDFDSMDDYESKVQALLDAGDVSLDPAIDISVTENPLVEGLNVDENFTSADLLQWIPEALVSDGAIDEELESLVFAGDGESEVIFEDETYPSSTLPIWIDDVADNGFDGVIVRNTIADDSSISTEIVFGSTGTMSQTQRGLVDDYFDEATPEGAEVSEDVDEDWYSGGRTMTFTSESPEELTENLATALGSESNEITFAEEPSSEDPTLFEITYEGTLDDSSVASPSASAVEHEVILPQGWNTADEQGSAAWSDTNEDGETVVTVDGAEFSVTFERSVPLETIDSATEISLGGGLAHTFEFRASEESVEEVGDAFEELLTPAEDTGSLETSQDDGSTVYTVTFEADDDAELQEQLEAYVPGSTVSVSRPEGFSFWPEYAVSVDVPVTESLLQGAPEGDVTQSVTLPMLNSFDEDTVAGSGATVDGRTLSMATSEDSDADEEASSALSADAKGPTAGSLITMGVLAFLVIAVILLVIIFRKRLAALFSSARQNSQQAWDDRQHSEAADPMYAAAPSGAAYAQNAGTAQPGLYGPAGGPGPAGTSPAGAGPDGAGPDGPGPQSPSGSWPQRFRESDLF